MIKNIKVLGILALFTISANAENVGWHSYLKENPTEFHDLLLNWESGDQTNVPDWLSGVFVRNGPAQVSLNNFLPVDPFIEKKSLTIAHIWVTKKASWKLARWLCQIE